MAWRGKLMLCATVDNITLVARFNPHKANITALLAVNSCNRQQWEEVAAGQAPRLAAMRQQYSKLDVPDPEAVEAQSSSLCDACVHCGGQEPASAALQQHALASLLLPSCLASLSKPFVL